MNTTETSARTDWKRVYLNKVPWVLGVSLASGLIGALLTMAHLQAKPIDLPLVQKNTTTQPVVHSVTYVPGKLWTYTLRSEPDNDKSPPIVFLLGELDARLVLPGESKITKSTSFGFMYLNENAIKKFPKAIKLATIEEGIVAQRIDTVNAVRGLQQLKDAYAKAHSQTSNE
ncbi:MAG TPA: hypothetical protein DHW22_13470 [Planctomycetaceae bacterium]|nr:hypothetical protein [Planctomycetaceae bacterium]